MTLQLQLHQAILYGDIAEINALIDQGADVNEPVDNELPLCTAILNGEIDVAIHLLQRGADTTLPRPSQPEIRPSTRRRLGSWELSRGTIVALQVALGVTLSVIFSTFVRWQNHTASVLRMLLGVLDVWIPWGATVVCLGVMLVLQMRAVRSREAVSGGGLVVAVLLCMYGTRYVLPARVRWGLAVVFSHIWKGCVWRALFLATLRIVHRRVDHSYQTQGQMGYPGLEIIDSLVASKFKSEKLMSSLLDSGLLTSDYIQEWKTVERKPLMQKDPLTTLWATAATLGFDNIVRRLIHLGMPVDTPLFTSSTYNSTTLLGIAASSGQPHVVEVLLENGADVEADTSDAQQSVWPCRPLVLCLYASDRYDTVSSESRSHALQLLIQAGADVNTPHHSGDSPLALAIQNCSVDIVRLLLQHGALPTSTEKHHGTLIHSATKRRNAAELLNLFGPEIGNVNATDDTSFTPLMRAAVEGNTDAARCLLNLGADPTAKSLDGWTVLQLAAWYGPRALLRMLLDTNIDVNAHEQDTNTALFQASRRHAGRIAVLGLLLDKGADPNIQAGSWKTGSTPLHEVCRCSSNSLDDPEDLTDQVDAVKILVQYGADVNATYSVDGVPNEIDTTPLGLAAAHAPYDVQALIFDILLNAGADPEGLSDTGLSALLTCCSNVCGESADANIPDPVATLLAHGADPTAKDSKGMTPLHHAALQHNLRATVSILSHFDAAGRTIALTTQDTHGRTPHHLATASPYWMTRAAYTRWSAHRNPGNADYANFHLSLASNRLLAALRFYGADPFLSDADGATALHVAAKAGNPRVVRMLLSWAGMRGLCDVSDRRGRLAVHYGVRAVEVIRVLLGLSSGGKGAEEEEFDVDGVGDGEGMEQLFEHDCTEDGLRVYDRYRSSEREGEDGNHASQSGNSFNAPDQLLNTPLHYAALSGTFAVVELYLSIPGIDLTCQNADGETVMDLARDERCAAAIAAKCKELGVSKAGETKRKGGEKKTERRREAERFVERLGEKAGWGVYREGWRDGGDEVGGGDVV